ncbi:DUF4238 domain-containing protein [Komagataeibacter melaceti]|uniref:DUF4238 domain-containing protein n=1 Tax=Komagataeibacter melaceti TaxID=2766577 RepID=A0A371YW50_9PROT|nr:DUF4238 domain-containing protein [Komagataeibacter melaceti]RFD18433.1 DUF4238 domain-containing protein [Komagataeibacter melaceti]
MTDNQTTDMNDNSEIRQTISEEQESKRHHHVPRLYLKRWCNERDELYEFRRFKKNAQVKSRPKSPKYTGFTWNCYDLDGLPITFPTIGRTHMEDRFFKNVDQPADGPLNLLNNLEIPSSNEDRTSLAMFLVSLVVRNPWFFGAMRSELNGTYFRELVTKFSEANREVDFSHFLASESGFDPACVLLFEEIIINKNILDTIINFHWDLACDDNSRLLTSDAPVWWSGFPDNNRDFFAMLSISPSLSLIIGNSKRTVDRVKKARTLFKEYNDNICKQAFKMIFSNNNNQQRFIDNRLERFDKYFALSNRKFMDFFIVNRCGKYLSPLEERLRDLRGHLHE